METGGSDTYTFTFEDNWPIYGDFDMSDPVIITSRGELKVNEDGIVERLRTALDLRAIGAAKTLGAGIRFVKLPQNIRPDKFTVSGKNVSFEDGQSLPTYILSNDTHTALRGSEYTDTSKFTNTVADGPFKKGTKEYSIVMELPVSINVKPEDLNVNHVDIFTITAPITVKRERTEVHVTSFAPIDLAIIYYPNSGNDSSSATESRYYLSKENLAWVVVIPRGFAWSTEHQKITIMYDRLKSWITTGGQQDNDWYKSHS